MSNFSFKLDDEKILKLKETFKEYIKPNKNEYIDTFIQKDDLTITIYNTNKVVFQGNDAFFYAQTYIDTKKARQAGSDEVGTGDAFGPVVVCASIVEESDYEFIEMNHIPC
jgi:ribonuclease HIII